MLAEVVNSNDGDSAEKNVVNKLKSFTEDQTLGQHRNLVAGFFKGMLGALLSIPTFGLALASSNFRSFFFGSRTQYNLNKIHTNASRAWRCS